MNCIAGITCSAGMPFKTLMFLYCSSASLGLDGGCVAGDCPGAPKVAMAVAKATEAIAKDNLGAEFLADDRGGFIGFMEKDLLATERECIKRRARRADRMPETFVAFK